MHAEGISNERRRWGGISSWLHSTVKPQTAIIRRIYIFSQGHAAVFKQSSFLSGMLFREMITRKGSLIHFVFFWFLHPSSSLPNLKEHPTSEHQSIEGFFFVFSCKATLGFSPITSAVLGPTPEVISRDLSQLSHLALYYTFQYTSDVFNVHFIPQNKYTLNFMKLMDVTN